eukprot:SAG11_NODE_1071_length_5977_cov_27.273562_1_plen_83_part_00
MHGTFACHGPWAVAHDPQCQKTAFQVTLRWAKYVIMTSMHKRHCYPTYEGLPARVYGYVWYLIDPLHIQYVVGKQTYSMERY